jgi:hypothetical protein
VSSYGFQPSGNPTSGKYLLRLFGTIASILWLVGGIFDGHWSPGPLVLAAILFGIAWVCKS